MSFIEGIKGKLGLGNDEARAKKKPSGGSRKSWFRRAFGLDRILGLAMLIAFLGMYAADPYPVEFMRLKTFDFYQKSHPRQIPAPQGKPVTIIDLDEDSLAEVGQWPWSRTTLAKLVNNLMKMGAAQVAFDIVFAEPDRMNPAEVSKVIRGLDKKTRERLSKLPSNDATFARIIKRSRVVLGQSGYWEKRDIKVGPPIKRSVAVKGPKPNRFLPRIPDMVRNIPIIEKAASGHGLFTLLPEPDGIVRRVPSMFVYGKDLYPALSVEMMRVAFQRQTVLVKTNQGGMQSIAIATKRQFPPKGLEIPTDAKGRIWPYFSVSDKAKYVSAKDVLNGTADKNLIRGKLTIVGTSAVGLLDIRSIPTAEVIPGVEVHAQLIEAAMHGAFLSRPNNVKGAEFLLILFVGLLMIWLVPRVGAKWTMLLFFTIAGGAGYTSWHLFIEYRILFDAVYAILAILMIYVLLTYTSYAKEEADRRQTRDAFSKYLSPDMVEKVAEDPSQLKLGGESRQLTLLFCDVRGFTTISEQFDATGLTALINKLLTPLTNVILKYQGTVDKYMGDCIMAFWNAPLDDENHARNGCISALKMLEEMDPLNERLEAEAIEEGRKHIPLKVGLGLNSGECVVGNMGSDQRFDYSVLGDTVNLAARLEGQSKTYGVRVVIGQTTALAVDDFAIFELDLIMVKGKTTGVHVYCLLGDEIVAESAEFKAFKEGSDRLLASYRGQDWQQARDIIASLSDQAAAYDISGFLDLYEERIADGIANPPGADWDGVFVATTK